MTTVVSDNKFPKLILVQQGADRDAAAAGERELFAKADGLYEVDDAGVVTGPLGTGGGGGGSTPVGNVLTAVPIGVALGSESTGETTASRARLMLVNIPGTMLLRNLSVRVTTAGSGTYQWGLFDYSANPAAAVKVAGGSGALNSTGWPAIAATGGPITVAAGNYALILKAPASATAAVVRAAAAGTTGKWTKYSDTFTWDDTPDLTPTGAIWTDTTQASHVMLVGDLSATHQW